MKRIAVLCDGTWNSADQPHATNVRQMALMLPSAPEGAEKQVVFYYNGVGVPEGGGWLERINEKLSGGAMGWGLDARIAAAYRHLCRAYEPGDEIHVFGFSRGAYTARSLVGLIRNCGIASDPTPEVVAEAFTRYRDRDDETKPSTEESMAFRLRISPGVTVTDNEPAFRRARGAPEGHPLTIAYLGVWDTVGALGIPSHWGLPARLLNRKYRFHDTELSSFVKAARHAVAIDERRRHFVPTLWTNLPDLRRDNPGGDYRQEWFAGNHGSVGGGGDIADLSSLALLWIADGAARAGLRYRPDALTLVQTQRNLLGPLDNKTGGASLGDVFMGLTAKARRGPDRVAEVAHPAIARWRVAEMPPGWGNRPYRPKTLARVADGIGAIDVATLEDYGAIAVA